MDIANMGMTAVGAIGNQLKANAAKMIASDYNSVTSKSLSQYTTELQLRPTFAIETELLNDSNMSTLIQTGLANYAGYYIVALSIDNTINGVSIGKALGKYSPTRDATGEAIRLMGQTVATVSTSSYKPVIVSGNTTLSTLSNKISVPARIPDLPSKYLAKLEVSTEATYYTVNPEAEAEDIAEGVFNYRETAVTSANNDVADEINKLANLAAGRILTVDVSREQAKAKVNILLKPELKSIRSNMLVEIAGITKKPKSMRERLIAYFDRGTINSAFDLFVCRDLVEAHRRNLVEDTTGYYEKTHNRNVNNKTAAMLTGEFSVGTVANTWIISDATRTRIQATIGAKLDNKRARDKFFEESGIMTLIVYNQDYQRIFIYNHGIDDVSEISMNYLEKKTKSDSFDMDVFKMLSQGSAPII
jgi:hypothetical protein